MGLAKIATEQAIRWAETQKEALVKKAEEELKKVQQLASQIDGLELVITVKLGKEEQLFEKITSQKISEKLADLGFEIKKEQIDLVEAISEPGEFPVKVKLKHNLEAEIKVIITEEKS